MNSIEYDMKEFIRLISIEKSRLLDIWNDFPVFVNGDIKYNFDLVVSSLNEIMDIAYNKNIPIEEEYNQEMGFIE